MIRTLIFCLLFLTSCGDVNPMKIFISESDRERIANKIKLGQVAYDQGDFDEAIEHAEFALAVNKYNERAAQLLGYSYLGKAGFAPFTVTGKIIEQGTKDTSGSDAIGILGNFSSLIELSDADVEKMGTLKVSENSYFQGLNLIYPHSLAGDDSPRVTVDAIKYIDKAMTTICPFIPNEILADQPTRFDTTTCSNSVGKQKAPSQSLFLFALGHLLEAIAFNSVLQYTSDTNSLRLKAESDSSNLFQRSDALKVSPEISQISDYIDAIAEIKQDITSVFNLEDNSMLSATLLDIRTAVGALGSIGGVPTSVTKQLQSALDSIKATADKLADSSEEAEKTTSQTKALKDQLASKINEKLNVNAKNFVNKYGTDEKDKLCDKLENTNGIDFGEPLDVCK